MGQFEDNNIVRLFGVILEEQNVMIVLEYLSQGDLQEYLINLKNTYVIMLLIIQACMLLRMQL